MPAITRTNLSRRTLNATSQRYTRANQTDEQCETRNDVERNRWIRNEQHRNIAFDPYRAAFNYNVEIDYSSQQIVVCQYCKNEAPEQCCASGQVKLTPLVPPPEQLHSLVFENCPDSKHFLTHIQQYNICFQMTSFSAVNVIRDNFIPTFKIQGQIYNLIRSVLPTPDSDYKFLQIYFMGNSLIQVD